MKTCKFLFLVLSTALLSACNYSPASLPDDIRSEFELALPLMNDTLSPYKDFQFIGSQNYSPFSIEPSASSWIDEQYIPAGTEIELKQTRKLPFFLKDFTTDQQTVQWIEPRFIIEDNLPTGTSIILNCHVIDKKGKYNNFFIEPDYRITSGSINIIPKDTPKRIANADLTAISESETLYVGINMVFSRDVKVVDLKAMELRIRFALRVKVAVNTAEKTPV